MLAHRKKAYLKKKESSNSPNQKLITADQEHKKKKFK